MPQSIPVIPEIQFLDGNGDPLAGGLVYTYETGTTTPLATYQDEAGTIPNTNPIVLDANGYATIWIDNTQRYRFRLEDANNVLQWQADDVTSANAILGAVSGALLVANDLSDLNDVPTALTNLGLGGLTSTTTAITASMGATSISGYAFTPGSWVSIEYYVTRNSAAVLGTGKIDLQYDGAAWQIVEGDYNFPTGKSLNHGLTFSMSGNQLQVAADSNGNGNLITRYILA